MKIKKNASIATSDFWYDLFEGGYIKPEDVLKDKAQIDEVNAAIELIQLFKSSLEEHIDYM